MKWIVIVTVLLLAGCGTSATPASPSAGTTPTIGQSVESPGGLLVEVTWSGGMCVDTGGRRVCETTMTIAPTGVYTLSGNLETPKVLTMANPELEQLKQLISAADFAALGATPFTGTCPRAYDGPAPVYTFFNAADTVRLDTCEVTIDQQAPLFRLLDMLQKRAWAE